MHTRWVRRRETVVWQRVANCTTWPHQVLDRNIATNQRRQKVDPNQSDLEFKTTVTVGHSLLHYCLSSASHFYPPPPNRENDLQLSDVKKKNSILSDVRFRRCASCHFYWFLVPLEYLLIGINFMAFFSRLRDSFNAFNRWTVQKSCLVFLSIISRQVP